MPLHSGLRVATSAARRSCGKKCGASSRRFGKSFLSPPSSRSSRPLASCLPALNRSAFSSRSPACFHGLCMGWCSSSPPRARDGKSSVSCGRRRWLSPPNYRRRTKGQEVLRPCPLCCLCLCACLVLSQAGPSTRLQRDPAGGPATAGAGQVLLFEVFRHALSVALPLPVRVPRRHRPGLRRVCIGIRPECPRPARQGSFEGRAPLLAVAASALGRENKYSDPTGGPRGRGGDGPDNTAGHAPLFWS